jgi:hypothetical protein
MKEGRKKGLQVGRKHYRKEGLHEGRKKRKRERNGRKERN